ncbi:MAG: VWA domain-containing protein [Acidobacteriia bacterium]|nr:VWA domain-containing protein [Terriglobia bacterium]
MILAIGLAISITTSWSKGSSQTQSDQRNQFEIKSSVNVVLMHVTVRDRDGNLVGLLNQDNFQVYEDGALQQIESFSHEDIPVTVGLVVDNSGSMKSKRPEVIAAALAFVRSSNSQDEMFVVNFNDGVSFGLPRNTPFTDQPDQLRLALSDVVAMGRTALYDAISDAVGHLKQGNHDKKALIVVSDGGDNASRHALSETMARAVKSDAMIYTIGLFDEDDPDRNPEVLKKLSKATGGDSFLPESIKDVQTICERIALEIRNQYTVTYISSNKKEDGSYRNIKVKVNAPDHGRLIVRARSGYYAPSNTESKRESKALSYESSN